MIAITPKRIRKAFYATLQQMEADRSLYVKDPLRDFTREGTFSFRRTMLFSPACGSRTLRNLMFLSDLLSPEIQSCDARTLACTS